MTAQHTTPSDTTQLINAFIPIFHSLMEAKPKIDSLIKTGLI